MNNIELMYIFNSTHDLLIKLACFWLLEATLRHNIIEELSTAGVFHNEVQLFWRFNNFIKLYNIWVSD